MKHNNIDPLEITKFSQLSAQWWDKEGDLKTLHEINPLRLCYINEKSSLSGKSVLDIGCGGGILAEGMDKMGAKVTGIDMSDASIQVAKYHQYESGTTVNYLVTTAEDLAMQSVNAFDVITCLEMLEHVPNPASIVEAASQLVKPGGKIFFSTLNRNLKSYLFAIIGAEYIMKLLPKNTHDYAKFIRPSELSHWARAAGLMVEDITGISYNPITKTYRLSKDIKVNYLVTCIKPTTNFP